VIRPATADDGPAIGRIKVATWHAAYRGLLPAALLDALDPVAEGDEWGAYAAAPPEGHRLVVACAPDGAVVGYGRSEPSPDADVPGAGEVAGLYVAPAAQRTGVGRTLLAWLVDDLGARGLEPIVLWHFVGNERAARVYAAAGFASDGARRPVPAMGVDEVRLRLAR
jgi:ribosomal protein S18 acetylase RimI-like enzyme